MPERQKRSLSPRQMPVTIRLSILFGSICIVGLSCRIMTPRNALTSDGSIEEELARAYHAVRIFPVDHADFPVPGPVTALDYSTSESIANMQESRTRRFGRLPSDLATHQCRYYRNIIKYDTPLLDPYSDEPYFLAIGKRASSFAIVSVGPDSMLSLSPETLSWDHDGALIKPDISFYYDPTNGASSYGDVILYFNENEPTKLSREDYLGVIEKYRRHELHENRPKQPQREPH